MSTEIVSPAPAPTGREQVHALEQRLATVHAARKAAHLAGDGLAAVQAKGQIGEVEELLTAARVQAHLDALAALEAQDAPLAGDEARLQAAYDTAFAAAQALMQSEPARVGAEQKKTNVAREQASAAGTRRDLVREARYDLQQLMAPHRAAIDALTR
jgi:hypothetical protein